MGGHRRRSHVGSPAGGNRINLSSGTGTTAPSEETGTLPKGFLNGILQIAPQDVWAVGGTGEKPLLLHWDGRSWQQPAIPQESGELNSVTAFGPDDVWVAGRDPDKPGGVSVLHWDGRTWTRRHPRRPGAGPPRRDRAHP